MDICQYFEESSRVWQDVCCLRSYSSPRCQVSMMGLTWSGPAKSHRKPNHVEPKSIRLSIKVLLSRRTTLDSSVKAPAFLSGIVLEKRPFPKVTTRSRVRLARSSRDACSFWDKYEWEVLLGYQWQLPSTILGAVGEKWCRDMQKTKSEQSKRKRKYGLHPKRVFPPGAVYENRLSFLC